MASIRAMTLADHAPIIARLQAAPGLSLRDADSHEATARYLARNPGLSFVAEDGGAIVGCLMSGHDGRRGYLQHLFVEDGHRRQGIAAALVRHCLDALAREGIFKSHVEVFTTNEVALAFWAAQGWHRRADIHRLSRVTNGRDNA